MRQRMIRKEAKKDIKMKNIGLKFIILFSLFVGLSAFVQNANAADSCNNSCSSMNECKPAANGHIFADSASKKIDSSCVRNNASSGCFNGMPISAGTGNYNSVGNRGASRNHYGSDIGTTGYPNAKAYPVADGGTIALTTNSTGGGRTMVINYESKCTGAGDKAYYTIYRHLRTYLKTSGKVNRTDEVAVIGGSNYKNGKLCDNPAQCSGSTCCRPFYDMHLHLELLLGKFSGSSTYVGNQASKILKPYCSNLNSLCGGCPATANCDNGKKGAPFGEGGSFDGSLASADQDAQVEATRSCQYGDYLDKNGCLFCELFKKIFNTASRIAKIANDLLAGPAKSVVSVGFLIWMAIYLLKQFVSFQGMSTGEMLKGLLFQGFRVAVVVLILSGAVYGVMDVTLNPVMKTGLSFANSLNPTSTCDESASYMQGIQGYEDSYSGAGVDGGLSKGLGRAILCSIKNLEDATGFMMSLGNYSVCLGVSPQNMPFNVLPHLGYITTGAFLWVAGMVLLVTFPWCLIDCILQMCITAALIPCGIAAYAFKSTARYLVVIWNFMINAMFNFVFMALIVYILNSMLRDWIGNSTPGLTDGNAPDPKVFITGWKANGIAWWGVNALKVFGICFLFSTFFEEAKDMAAKFADSPGLGGSKGIGRMVGGTMADMGNKYVAQPAMHIAAKTGKAIGRDMNDMFGDAVRSKMNQGRGYLMSKFGGEAIKDEAGNTVGYKHHMKLFGMDINRTVSMDENGQWVRQKETVVKSENGQDSRIVTTSGPGQKTREVYDENNNLIKQTGKNYAGSARNIVENDGSIRKDVAAELMSGPNKEAAAAIMLQAAMQKQGMQLDETFKNRQMNVGKDGSISMVQVNKDGTTQTINAQMVEINGKTMMVINEQKADAKGNLISATLSNGMQKRVTSFGKDREGNTTAQTQYSFNEYLERKNSHNGIVNMFGEWGNLADRDAIMAGFDSQDYDMHMKQMYGNQSDKIEAARYNPFGQNNMNGSGFDFLGGTNGANSGGDNQLSEKEIRRQAAHERLEERRRERERQEQQRQREREERKNERRERYDRINQQKQHEREERRRERDERYSKK